MVQSAMRQLLMKSVLLISDPSAVSAVELRHPRLQPILPNAHEQADANSHNNAGL